MTSTPKQSLHYAFVFIEIFSQEGGIQSYVKDIFRAYLSLPETSSNHTRTDVFLLRDAPGCNNPFDTGKIDFHYLKKQSAWQGRLNLAITLFRYLVKHRPKRVFCGHIKLAPLVKMLCQPLGIPYTVLTYGKEVWQRLPDSQRKAIAQASSIWTISRYSRDRLTQANEIDLNKVKILPCVVDGEIFKPGEKPAELIERYQLYKNQVLMTVARLWSGDIYKGVDVTIRALPQILSVFPDVKYLIIGRGDDRPRLEQLAKDLDISDRIVFAGFVPTQELVAHYQVADAYIMPSQEGFGIVYLEAMACGIPVLSGDADGSAEPLQDGRLGWRVPHRDPDAVAAACLEILNNRDPRCQGQWLREQTLEKFGRQALFEKLKQLLSEF